MSKTCSSIFLTPFLMKNRAKAKQLGYINSYLKDTQRDIEYINPVFALFKPQDIQYFNDFLDGEKEKGYLRDDYDYEGGYVVLVYEFPLLEDYQLFLQGKYSMMSNEYKENIPKITKILHEGKLRDEISLAYRVCHKTPDLKIYWENKLEVELDEDQEYFRVPNIEEETLDINKIRTYEESNGVSNIEA